MTYLALNIYHFKISNYSNLEPPLQTIKTKPVTVCIICNKTSIFRDKIGKFCYIRNDGNRCLGFFIRRLRALDWVVCSECNGFGIIYGVLCSNCYGDGWVIGKRLRSDSENKLQRNQ